MSFTRYPQNWWLRPIIDEPLFPPTRHNAFDEFYTDYTNPFSEHRRLRDRRNQTRSCPWILEHQNDQTCPMRNCPPMADRCPVFRNSDESKVKYASHTKNVTTRRVNGQVISEEHETIEHEDGTKEETHVKTIGDKKVTKVTKTTADGTESVSTNFENCNEQNFLTDWQALTN